MDMFIDILFWICKILTFYTAALSVFFLFPRRKCPQAAPNTRFALLIPARNEERVIANIVESLLKQDYPCRFYDIFVIPNNCTDDTEGAALRAGAKVLHCRCAVSSKGEVLRDIFDQLQGQYEAYCVFDADNIVDPSFLSRMNDRVCAGAHVAKSHLLAINPYDSWVAGCYDIYFANCHLLYNLSRDRLGLNAKLVGTGFMVTDDLLRRMGGWNTTTLTEDTEFTAQCAIWGERVHYVPEALVYDEEPLTFSLSLRQRRRWSAGVLSVAGRYVPRLLARPTLRRLDYAIFLCMIPVQLLAVIPVLYGLIGMEPMNILTTLAVSLSSFAGGAIITSLLLALVNRRCIRKMWKSILLYPVFLASWYVLHFACLFVKPKVWHPIPHGVHHGDKHPAA